MGRLDILVNCAIAIPDALTVPRPLLAEAAGMTGLLDVVCCVPPTWPVIARLAC